MDHVLSLRCLLCGTEHRPDEVAYVCPAHGDDGVLDVVYDYDLIGRRTTRESVERELAKAGLSVREQAFATILKNRTYHGGILAEGSAMIKHGENGKGISSRWYADTLKKRILDIAAMRDHFTFIEGDGLDILRQQAHRSDAVFFIDPPYTAGGKRAGSRLYTHFKLDHEALFRIASTLAGDFLMTYDDAEELRNLAKKYGFDTERIAMKNTHHAKMTELLIGRCLDWVRPAKW